LLTHVPKIFLGEEAKNALLLWLRSAWVIIINVHTMASEVEDFLYMER